MVILPKVTLAVLALTPLPNAALGQSVFDGTWKMDLSTPPVSKPLVWLVQNGIYRCDSCVPPITVTANGQDQRVTGQPYDTIAVTVVDERIILEIEKKGSKVVGNEKFTVSQDGNTVVDKFPNGQEANGVPQYTEAVFTRIAKGPAGAHALSGSWQMSKIENVADEFLLITLKVEDGYLEMSRPTGQSFKAKLDGTDAPYRGDPHTNTVSVKLLGKNAIEETDKHDGETLNFTRFTVVSDGRTMTIESRDATTGSTSRYLAHKVGS